MRSPTVFSLVATLPVSLALLNGPITAQEGYQKPPQAILDILNSKPTPSVSISPTRDRLLLVEGTRYPPIADLAQPMLRLAGLRINPNTNGPHSPPRVVGLTLQTIADGKQQPLAVPKDVNLSGPNWSHTGKLFAFTATSDTAIELWIGDAATGQLRKIEGVVLNGIARPSVQWMPDGATLLCMTVPKDRGALPQPPRAPKGPVVQESSGRAGPIRTFQDLLQNEHDEALYEYFATAQLVQVDAATGKSTPIGKPALFGDVDCAPDGKHLLVTRIERPFSYLHTAGSFPKSVQVWDSTGKLVKQLSSHPLQDRVPIEGVPTGPRSYQWRPTEPATLTWVEALDEGDPKKKVPHRDRIFMQKAPFQEMPREIAKTEHRFAGLSWGEHDGMVLLRDFERDRRRSRTFLQFVDKPSVEPRVVWDRSTQDRYGDPGFPMNKLLPSGHRVLWQVGDYLFLDGPGASPQGNRPFLDRLHLGTLKTERLFHCEEGVYEAVQNFVADDASSFITLRESPTEPPNFFVREVGKPGRRALTHFVDPAPQLRDIKKQLVTYKRPDGVQLSFTLYLPPGYKQGERLPTVVWAYPQEFTDASVASQVSGSPNRFTMLGGTSHLFFLLQGYAVLDNASMPVVGDPETVNNTYVEQIAASAKAAIDKAVEMGVTDPERVGVGGHSYGAFMTANLLAHSDLFRAGIARSGAYNRTLTPFGFQSERRTYWEAPETYAKMSPFTYAHKIKEPILLIHGANDNNAGTFPIQSERLYQAIRGNGGTVRFVLLPFESHGYAARESVEHTLWEMLSWFDRHVKNPSISK